MSLYYFFAQELCNQIKGFFLPKAFLIWIKFLAESALIWIFVQKDKTSRFDENLLPKSALTWRVFLTVGCLDLTKISSRSLPWFDKKILFFLGVRCLGLTKFSCWLGGENIFEIVLKPESLKLLKYEIFQILSNQAKILHFCFDF